jgi:hypothetical protein
MGVCRSRFAHSRRVESSAELLLSMVPTPHKRRLIVANTFRLIRTLIAARHVMFQASVRTNLLCEVRRKEIKEI